ncbi:MAG TPA: ferrochelatase [Bryobacteraceae bacterium]|nr:ferrochelatase [Bryobacteraceae bacterium]
MYDALLLISFGGPESHDDVIPFLENVLRGRNVPRERMLAVAEHYYHFDGRSPINQQCRDLITALAPLVPLPVYWGNRNWHPMLPDTVRRMKENGVQRALAIATSAFGSYSGCRQYREDIEKSGAEFPIDKVPPYWNHPGFIEAMADNVREALAKLPDAEVVYTAHSIPVSMAQASPYEEQLRAAAQMVNQRVELGEPVFAFQSRSGPPSQPWLDPDIGDYIRQTESKRLIVVPIGFLSDHMEVLYDLDLEAAELARERGIDFVRAATAGTHPKFVAGLADIVQTAMANAITSCRADCCQPAARPASAASRQP